MIDSIENPLTLYSLNTLVRDTLNDTLPSQYWVTGELSEVRETSAGHCYIELVQRDEVSGGIVAKARGTVWSRIYALLRPYFLEQTGQLFAAGLQVLLKVKVVFHELYGYSLDVCDIEPAYTVGDMARRRMMVIKRLTDEGVIDLNKELLFPLLPQRIAVISSSTAAGYGDFCDQLLHNRYGFVFYPSLFPSPMQGNSVEQGIIAALDRIAENIDLWDVVVIIRGGGATSELSCFDTYDLANNCAQFPLPIITGIGHQRDESVLDMVAHTRAKTPTAAAEFLIHAMLEQGTSLENARQTVFTAVRSLMDAERVRLNALSGQLPVCAALGVQSTRMYLQSVAQRLFPAAEMILKEQRYKLEIMKEKVEAASPEHILALGYSITRVNGRAVRSADDVVPGDEVTTFVAGGAFTSMVTEKNSR